MGSSLADVTMLITSSSWLATDSTEIQPQIHDPTIGQPQILDENGMTEIYRDREDIKQMTFRVWAETGGLIFEPRFLAVLHQHHTEKKHFVE